LSYAPKRPHLSKKTRALVLELGFGCCYICGLIIVGGIFDVEHVIPRELGGSDDLDNLRPAHKVPCHRDKTKADRKLIAKSNHVRRKHGLDPDERKPRPKMKSRNTFHKGPSKWPSQKLPSRQFPKPRTS
jgi:hypothetical protein